MLYTSPPGRPYTSPPGRPYTSPPGRPVPLHFTPWQTCSFTLHPLADLFLYTSPLADLFLYTSPPGRPVPLHFTPWQTCSFTLHPLADLFIPKPFQLLWEAFSHAAITAQRLFVHISTTICIARYSFIQLSELWQRGVIKLAKGSK